MKKIKKIKISVNGKKAFLKEKETLLRLIQDMNIPLNKVAIELNKEIVNKKKLNNIKLSNNDKIEIVHFIGGG